jgi:hypothetical protein
MEHVDIYKQREHTISEAMDKGLEARMHHIATI